jgi:hypothetical protein
MRIYIIGRVYLWLFIGTAFTQLFSCFARYKYFLEKLSVALQRQRRKFKAGKVEKGYLPLPESF